MDRKEACFMSEYIFKSVFAPYMNTFLNVKEAMGFGLRKFREILKEFDRFFIAEIVTELFISQSLIAKWRAGRLNDSSRTLYDKYSILSQFSKYMSHLGYPCYAPRLPKRDFGDYVPYVFTHEQIRAIFHACDSIVMFNNNMDSKLFAMPAILRLLYGTGLRVSEAVALRNRDVDLDRSRIVVRKTKNQQQRLIPLNPSMHQVLCQYRDARNRLPLPEINTADAFFFISPSGHPLNIGNVYTWFRTVLKKCAIPHIGKHHGPRVHDLRHTCAVHSLMAQVQSGADIYCVLPILSVFLGHRTLVGTERYVRLTQEMYPDIIKLEQSVSSFVFPSFSNPEIAIDYEE
jgi:integrase